MVIYGIGTNYTTDTIWPGKCGVISATDIRVEYDQYGNELSSSTSTFSFYTGGGSYAIRIDTCYKEIEAPGGYVDLQAHCNNGKFEPHLGELNTDCGENCGPCPAFGLPCQFSNDTIHWDMLTSVSGNGIYNTLREFLSDEYRFSYEFGSSSKLEGILKIPKLPAGDRKFVVGNTSHKGSLSYKQGFSSQWRAKENQEFYLLKAGKGKWILEFCNLQFDGPTTIKGSGRLLLEERP